MAYAKLFRVCQDFILGKEQVNGAIANAAAIRDAYAAEHRLSVQDGGSQLATPLAAGRHDDVLIPRGIVAVTVSAPAVIGGTTASFELDLASSPYVVGVERLSAGVWFIEARFMGADPWCELETTATAVTQIRGGRADWQLNFQGRTGFLVQTFSQAVAAGTFAAADVSFCCRIFSR